MDDKPSHKLPKILSAAYCNGACFYVEKTEQAIYLIKTVGGASIACVKIEPDHFDAFAEMIAKAGQNLKNR